MANDPDARTVMTSSGIPVEAVYAEESTDWSPREELGAPGAYPFTRGIHPAMYRERLWTMRQYAGFGTAEETNRRYHYLLGQGTTGLSVAFDLPTQMGYDSDHPIAAGEVGRVGVAIDSLDDMRTLFDGIALDSVSTSMTINSTAAILLAFYVALADERGISRSELRGTVQNDILKEYVARGTYVYPVDPSLRLVSDLMAFCAKEAPRWNPISISGYHIREAGATAPQEIGFTFANGIEYVNRALEKGIPLGDFLPRISFFFAAHSDLLEEVAKFRAARRLWARLMRHRYDADDRCSRLRFHTQTGGSTLTAQQPMNNVARVTIQALAAVLGGTQSLHTNGYDEALALPSEEAARIALRTQQILAHESGVPKTVDPLAGSYYVERLTSEIEERAERYVVEVEARGGAARSLEYMRSEIHDAAYRLQLEIESEERVIVGVNSFSGGGASSSPPSPDFPGLERAQRDRLRGLRTQRDSERVLESRNRIGRTARSEDNLLPPMIAAVKVGATLGEISETLREEWGRFDSR